MKYLYNSDFYTPPTTYCDPCHPECNPDNFLLNILHKFNPVGVESRGLMLQATAVNKKLPVNQPKTNFSHRNHRINYPNVGKFHNRWF